jgi:integrase
MRLSVPLVQTFLNQKLTAGYSVRSVQIMREVLSSALTRANREELLSRNVARLVELPTWEWGEIRPWTADEAKRFMEAARADPLYPAFVLLLLYGLRRGEVLGLRWGDVDFAGLVLRIRQQVQRVGGELRQGPVKTRAGRRDLPLLGTVRDVLMLERIRQEGGGEGLVFTTRSGQPIEPRNLVRSFQRICIQHGIRNIRVHDVRHTTATLLKNLGVPARDAQLILGHSTVTITQEIYQHDDMVSRTEALAGVEKLFMRTVGSMRCRQVQPSTKQIVEQLTTFYSGRRDRIRTCDPRFWSSISGSVRDRLTAVDVVMQVCTRQWLLGVVAVSLAVKSSSAGI